MTILLLVGFYGMMAALSSNLFLVAARPRSTRNTPLKAHEGLNPWPKAPKFDVHVSKLDFPNLELPAAECLNTAAHAIGAAKH